MSCGRYFAAPPPARVLLLEPFYGGSHKQLLDLLSAHLDSCVAFTAPAKKWHWKARTSALDFSQRVTPNPTYRVLFCSSVLNLCELAALRPDLARLKKVVYFHENQLVYPVRKEQDRDFQYGYNQIVSCLVADAVVFNSAFNMDSFLSSVPSFLNKIPDRCPPDDVVRVIRPKCRVLHFPLRLGDVGREHDKDPELFFSTMLKLKEEGLDFLVSVLGEAFTDVPEVFARCRPLLDSHVLHWGYLESRELYLSVLYARHVGGDTCKHTHKLTPPLFGPSAEYLYATPQQLLKRLRSFCGQPSRVRTHAVKVLHTHTQARIGLEAQVWQMHGWEQPPEGAILNQGSPPSLAVTWIGQLVDFLVGGRQRCAGGLPA
uniref:tRNA-queuosine alpha-mannosyltransferase n=1 Tax=Hippocampus comes TaxID=109280 RepID=A0A3Q2Z1Y2_HIPCM